MTDTIVMIHGMWGSSWYWEDYKKFFESKGYSCVTPVLRLHDVAGNEDRITPATVVKNVAQKYKSVSTYKEFEHHAHWIVAEPGWRDVATYAYEWLQNVPAERRA